jgi:hypothetical protein
MSVASPSVDQRIAATVTNRYSDAYLVARTINALGQTVKIAGFVVGGIILFGSMVVGSRGAVGALFGFTGFIVAVLVAAVFFLFGTLLSAQGQILMATLDTAVNTSSFLPEAERARLLSISASTSTSVSAQSYSMTPRASAPPTGPWRCSCGQNNPEEQNACLDCGVARVLPAV